MTVEQVSDRGELREFLMRDRIANAYLLGNLDPAYFQFCRWYGARNEQGALGNLLLVYRGLSLPVVFMAGNAPEIEEFLRDSAEVLPDRFHFHVLENHMTPVRSSLAPSEVKAMHRMGLDRANYKRYGDTSRVVRLGHRDTAAIMELFAHYPDNFFEPYQLETGLYFGIRDPELGLVSIAGVHVVSEEHDVAVIGNLVTHREMRGQGLATACTARLLEELFERVSLVALNVQQDNEAAIRMYRHFGFEFNNVFFEGQYALTQSTD